MWTKTAAGVYVTKSLPFFIDQGKNYRFFFFFIFHPPVRASSYFGWLKIVRELGCSSSSSFLCPFLLLDFSTGRSYFKTFLTHILGWFFVFIFFFFCLWVVGPLPPATAQQRTVGRQRSASRDASLFCVQKSAAANGAFGCMLLLLLL